MIEVFDIVDDSDLGAPEPITIIRSIKGKFVLGGFTSDTITIEARGPVQPASDKEIEMLPVADIVGQVKAFWLTQPVYTVSGKAPVPSVRFEYPTGTFPGTVYTLSEPAPDDSAQVILTGAELDPSAYTLSGTTLTLNNATEPTDWIAVQWIITALQELRKSDVLVYGDDQYRVLAVKRYPGSGYWKAYGTRLSPQ